MTASPSVLGFRLVAKAFAVSALSLAGCLGSCTLLRAAPPTTGFRALLEDRQRETLRAVQQYVEQNPQADDAEQAAVWALTTASGAGLEAEVLTLAEQTLARRDIDQASRQAAQTALCIGLARSGKLAEGVAQFDAYLTGARFQSPFRTLDLAGALAAQARIAGRPEVARDVYERVASAYPLQAQIGEIIEGRIARQSLIGQPAPPVSATDVAGQAFDLAGWQGKVVLVDFWATNCAPCLEEFPNLRQLYKELQSLGFEIVGVSFDDGPETVQAFAARARLPWRMVMNESAQGTISDRFRTRTIPALFLVARDGRIAQVDVRGNDLRRVVEGLLAAPERP